MTRSQGCGCAWGWLFAQVKFFLWVTCSQSSGRCLSETVTMLALRQYCPVWLFLEPAVVLQESREGVSYVAIVAENSKKSKWNVAWVAYPSLRVEIEKVKIEGDRGLPPLLLGP